MLWASNIFFFVLFGFILVRNLLDSCSLWKLDFDFCFLFYGSKYLQNCLSFVIFFWMPRFAVHVWWKFNWNSFFSSNLNIRIRWTGALFNAHSYITNSENALSILNQLNQIMHSVVFGFWIILQILLRHIFFDFRSKYISTLMLHTFYTNRFLSSSHNSITMKIIVNRSIILIRHRRIIILISITE